MLATLSGFQPLATAGRIRRGIIMMKYPYFSRYLFYPFMHDCDIISDL